MEGYDPSEFVKAQCPEPFVPIQDKGIGDKGAAEHQLVLYLKEGTQSDPPTAPPEHLSRPDTKLAQVDPSWPQVGFSSRHCSELSQYYLKGATGPADCAQAFQ